MGQFRSAAVWALSAALSAGVLAGPPDTSEVGKPPVPGASTPSGKAGAVGAGEAPKGLDAIQHPGLRLGARVNLIERQFEVIPTLVIVPDEASFVQAIRGWRTKDVGIRYPILIDDMTWSSRMRIAQFVRAFKPRRIVRWKASGAEANLPPDPAECQGRLETIVANVWGATSAGGLKKVWEERGFVPPGAVVCSLKDPAWTAGVALAAFHGEPIVWVDLPDSPDPTGYLIPAQVDALSEQVAKGLEATGWKWNKLGDDIDAITLCATTPSRVWLGPGDSLGEQQGWATAIDTRTSRKFLSLTDMLGRTGKPPPKPDPTAIPPAEPVKPLPPARWAWCGQIVGSSSRAAYDAMCAAFLLPERAWLFDGYEATGRWNEFDMTRAASALERIGIASLLDDAPSGKGIAEFRARAAGQRPGAPDAGMGVDAGLIAINTKGNPDFFDLSPGQGKPVDAPILHRPAMLYLVHSFSAAAPTSRQTVGGVWLDRGVYAYLGSVEEPFLQGFVPTPNVMARLAGGMIWGAAVRLDNFEAWKLAVFGDPLITFGPQGQRTESVPLPLEGVEDVASALPNQLRSKDYLGAMWTLLLTGRDKDADRLLAAIAARDPKQVDTEVALAGVTSAFLVGDYPTFLTAAAGCKPALLDAARVRRNGLGEVRDMVWQAIWAHSDHPTRQETDLLADLIRPENEARDVDELRQMLDRVSK
jgi:hypothetical protein